MKRITVLLSILLFAASLSAQETSTTKPSGISITLNNSLPETVKDVFTIETLAERFPDNYPFDVWAMIGLQDETTLILIAKVVSYDPNVDPLLALKIQSDPRAPYAFLRISGPIKLMGKLSAWYQTQSRELQQDYLSEPAFANAPVFVIGYEKGEEERLIFQGGYTGRKLHLLQPIVAQVPGYKQANIMGSQAFGNSYSVQSRIDGGLWYPIDNPIDSVTGQKRTSWLIYSFLEMEPE